MSELRDVTTIGVGVAVESKLLSRPYNRKRRIAFSQFNRSPVAKLWNWADGMNNTT